MKKQGKTSISARIKGLKPGEQCIIHKHECKPSVVRVMVYHIGKDCDPEKRFETKMLDGVLIVTRVK